eukprot:CAMPEP_0117019744 /NCGR_PEP_ID=MMETSP0472-20121206/15103_1 /TAXON_ID=693140 ORGANISM="Tiarina fusus, Strain LIS" /NCGR_SAMPLE_ID=MMETSP0472 /ASSEMBLY_ACC=CAM_ASM_000603 /LENGTH=1103 /DNA_ID=CAMNT_0004724777 /DNA_START=181 /DNA_END=3489 /DNA_ORIENTATION=+
MAAGDTTSADVVNKWKSEVDSSKAANGKAHPPNPDADAQKAIEKMAKSVLLSAVTWDVFAPPPRNSIKGKVVPRVVNKFKNRRKLSLEIHRVTPSVDPGEKRGKETFSYEECVLRTLVPANKRKSQEVKKEAFTRRSLDKGSNSTFTSIRDINVDENDDDDDRSVNTSMEGTNGVLRDTGGKNFDGWKPKYRFPCRSVTIKSQHKKSVFVLIQVQKVKQERELIFDTMGDAQTFCDTLAREKQNEVNRAEIRLQAALGDIKLPPFETITLLVEIVSGWSLPIGDFTSSDPYVVCMLGREEVHKTMHISKTLDPIWTLKTGSLFLLEVESKHLFVEEGLTLLVKDYDQFGGNEMLGVVKVPAHKLYQAKGERMELKLQPPPGSRETEIGGYLALRCRRATEYDKKFMAGYDESCKAVAATEIPKSKTSDIRSIVTRKERVEKDGTKKFKVRPCPDPENAEETDWMTNEQIQAEVMKPSRHWSHAGVGDKGRIYVEVLSCDGLPNLDTGGFLGNKTDAFVSLVYEDVYVRTDTIDDCLSPRWMPWSNRAFIFNIDHSSSQVFLGVFDFDAGGVFDDHDLIGKATIDVTNLRKNTDYTLSYNICPSSIVTGHKIQGKVTIRLRLEIPDERKLVLCALEPPKPVYVNVKKRKDFMVVRQTCLGRTDTDVYSISTIKSYVDELRAYQHSLFFIEDALMTLLLWRGHFPLKIGSNVIRLPVHSFNAFVVAILLVENPRYYPSFCFLCIAWLLLAVMGWRRNSPDVWGRCYSFGEILSQLITGESKAGPHDIKPFEGYEESTAATKQFMKRVADAEAKAARDYAEAQKVEEERLKDLAEIGDADADISTKVGGGISIDPIKTALHPVQLMLGMVCGALRFVKNVVIWEEAYFSFWIASGCIVLAVACLFVPWVFIMKWTARIIVWSVFGPWMKLLDVFYFSKLKPESDKEREARELEERLLRRLATTEAASRARAIREDATKMRVMKKYMFGKFSVKVPVIKQDRYYDRPLPDSTAAPHQEKAMTLAELAMQEAGYNRTRLPGQTLVGDMIPMVETQTFTAAPTGKATANPDALARNAPGGGEKKKSDSTVSAYVKLGTIVGAAGVLTVW